MTSVATAPCRICGSDEVHYHRTMPSLIPSAGPVTFVECEACGTVMDSTGATQVYTPDGIEHFNTWTRHQYQLEVGAGLPFMAMHLYLAETLLARNGTRSNKSPGQTVQFLDIGGGLGLAAEMARRLGWRSVNVEPSNAGEYCEELLGIEVRHDYLTKGQLPEHSFDVILSSEVIEHVPDPDEFASTIASYLSDDGVAILTTPNSELVRDRTSGEHPEELRESYNPGFHVTVFSPHSLERVLRRNGFNDVRVITSEGTTGRKRLVAVASRRAGSLPTDLRALLDHEQIERQMLEHLTWVVERREKRGQRDAWYYGACFRLFENYVNSCQFEKADGYRKRIDEHLRERELTVEAVSRLEAIDLDDLLRQVPAYVGKYFFFRGMYELNNGGDLDRAAADFHAAYHFYAFLESIALCLGDFQVQSRFHEGLALSRAGKNREAVALFDDMGKLAAKMPNGLAERIRWERAVARLHLGDEAGAISDFAAIALEQFDMIRDGMRSPINHLLNAGLKRVDAIQGQVLDGSNRVAGLVSRVTDEIHEMGPKVHARLVRVDELANRGHALADAIEDGVDLGVTRLTDYAQRGTEWGGQLQAQLKAGSQRVNNLIDRSYEMSEQLEANVRAAAERLSELADRSLDLSQKAEKGLGRLSDTYRNAQQLFECNPGAAGDMHARCIKVIAALETTARSAQATTDFICRCLTTVNSAITFPLRAVRSVWRAIGLRGQELSMYHVGLPHALEFEGRIPLAEIVPGTVVEQKISSKQSGLCAVCLTFRSSQKKPRRSTPIRCTLQLAIVDGQGIVIRQANVDASTLCDGRPTRIGFDPIQESHGKSYRLRITSSDSCPGNAVTVWARLANSPRGMTFNGKLVDDAELIMELDYSRISPTKSIVPSPAIAARPVAMAAPRLAPPTFSLSPSPVASVTNRTSAMAIAASERDLLIVCPDRLGGTRIGLAMRHWEISNALNQAGLRVTLATTQPLPNDLPSATFPIVDFSSRGSEHEAVAKRHAAIMVQGGALRDCPWLREIGRPIVADMITPFHIENIQTSQDDFQRSLSIITDSLCKADFYVCGNERQRIYWLGMLTALDRLSKTQRDRDPEFRKLIDVVGFGIPAEEPVVRKPALKGVVRGIHRGDFVLTWFGGIWDWLDPMPLVHGVCEAYKVNPRIKLFFSMFRRANEQPTQTAQRVHNLAVQLGVLNKCIFFSDLPVPFDDRADFLLDSDMGVILQSPNFETQISARTRAMDYFWANLPILINRGDEIAEIVEPHGLGLVLDSSDSSEICRSLLAYVGDASLNAAARQAIQEHKSRFQWSRMVQPLVDFCRETVDTEL